MDANGSSSTFWLAGLLAFLILAVAGEILAAKHFWDTLKTARHLQHGDVNKTETEEDASSPLWLPLDSSVRAYGPVVWKRSTKTTITLESGLEADSLAEDIRSHRARRLLIHGIVVSAIRATRKTTDGTVVIEVASTKSEVQFASVGVQADDVSNAGYGRVITHVLAF